MRYVLNVWNMIKTAVFLQEMDIFSGTFSSEISLRQFPSTFPLPFLDIDDISSSRLRAYCKSNIFVLHSFFQHQCCKMKQRQWITEPS